ncbi:myoferlin-like isoform X4 [Macrobrachium rosenbergii]|uniref:myoferlin-like isoform X4 n=1 Tax=Macrobrachium rosenbergii TaxID=79674 RepID=UPI0034D5E970
MSLEISVVSASSLQNLETLGKSDPYVTINFQGEKKKTTVKDGTLDPVWDETLKWELGIKAPRSDECIDIEVKDYERIGRNRLLGKATIALRNIVLAAPGTPLDYELGLLGADDSPTVGTLRLTLSYVPPAGVATAGSGGSVGAIAARSAAVSSDLADGRENGVAMHEPSSSAGDKTSGKKKDKLKDGIKGLAGCIPIGSSKSSISAAPDASAESVPKGGMPQMGTPNSRNRDALSSAKTKFQIRVRVVEGRQLLGANMNPICRIKFDGETKQTRIHKGTTNPWFDEIFFFQVEKLPHEVLEDFLELQVCNSSGIRSCTLIGSFKCELGMVYDQPEFAFVNRWLVLANPDEPTPTVQGYLKASVAVLGPGNVCPDLSAGKSDQDDVEANLLWSAGVHLQPATFVLSIYCAQDLPRMDAGTLQSLKEMLGVGKASKELVDPYAIVSYAGKEVQTKVLYTNENPEFRQNLHIGFLFPSMCNVIRLTLMDWDRVGQDDVIGTATIPVSAISAPGEDGFLPTFGPTWVNVYGARREWELLDGESAEKMNVGADRGCAYRGRVLCALHTQVGSYPPAPATAIDNDAFNSVRRFRSTRRFVLICQLTGTWLLENTGRPLEIEVSVGNFGNKLENTILPSPSSTHPANAVFDGCKYYFLPWDEASPFVMVNCEYEDVTHRLHAVNHITSIIDRLKKDIRGLKSTLRARRTSEGDQEVTNMLQTVISRLVAKCSLKLPEVDPVRHIETSLDKHLRDRRRSELDHLKNTAQAIDTSNVTQAMEELESIVSSLESLAQAPQNGIPDVFLWLMSGTRRLAFIRIPAHSVLYAHEPTSQGALAGKFHTYTLEYPDDKNRWSIGGVVRASVWLGREEDIRNWWDARPDVQLTVYAETYENQVISVPGSGKWTDKGLLMTRPPFSDADGRFTLSREAFFEPDGWAFQGDWFVDPDPSVRFAADAGRQLFTEEVFEQQVRIPGGTWIPAPNNWADVRGDPATHRDKIALAEGWSWRDVWSYDLQRAVDGEGWEYTVEAGIMGWSPQEKIFHVCRRRRWIRDRYLTHKVEKHMSLPIDGWEYAPLFRLQFHALERKIDMVRRRRWRRRLVPTQQGLPPTPRLAVKAGTGEEEFTQLTCPRMYIVSAERHEYQLRAHIYQARDLPAGDKTGLSDPYAVVSFCNSTQQTDKRSATLCPTWDETLIFDDVKLSGSVGTTETQPPDIVVEIFDWDARGAPEFLGRVFCRPTVLNTSEGYDPCPLQWYPLARGNEKQGELLASFEMLLKDVGELPILPPVRGDFYMVPFGVRPLLQRTRIEVLCWGVRNMATYELQSVTRPSIEFECGGETVLSPVMANLRVNPNFDKPHLVFDVELPKEELYLPPLTLRVFDHRAFGSKPLVATAVVADLHQYATEPKVSRKKRKGKKVPPVTRDHMLVTAISSLEAKPGKGKPGTLDTDVDWWAKFYASSGQAERSGSYLAKGYEKLTVLSGALEDEPKYNGFRDLVDTIPLYRGRGEQAQFSGEFKGTFRIYPLNAEDTEEPPFVLDGFPSPDPQELLARVYIVMGRDLAPKDAGGSSDPYVTVSFGKTKKTSKEDYRPNTLNPIFGHVFEVSGLLPLHKDLKIQVYDRDLMSSDDLIGETVIDLENRYLSRHRATLGLPRQYHVSGVNAWRDIDLPTEILLHAARTRNLEGPVWHSDPLSLTLGGITYSLTDFEPKDGALPLTVGDPRERLALHVLHKALPIVPEHVETRELTHPAMPGLPQGQLLLWVDLFPANISPLPPAVDITPRQPQKYILRVVIYNVFEAPLQETSFVAKEKMSDVYVKGWLQGTNNVQKTDIHYRCMDGEANFNWRLVYHLEMIEAEQVMVVEHKEHAWSLKSTQQRRPPQLTLQLWDNDLIMRDDYLSEMTLDLCNLPKPAKTLKGVGPDQVPQMMGNGDINSVTINILDDYKNNVNLFEAKRVYGYFPFTSVVDGITEIAGKVEMEMEVLTEEEAKERPAGQGRDEPNLNPKLPDPERPATSFLWISSPWKSFRHIIWKNYKWYCITFIIFFLLFLFLFLFLYSLPGATVDYLVGGN